jgi:hypothetical protein
LPSGGPDNLEIKSTGSGVAAEFVEVPFHPHKELSMAPLEALRALNPPGVATEFSRAEFQEEP